MRIWEELGANDTLLNYKVMAGLASHVEKGAMTEEGVKRAIKTINAHLRRASHFNCDYRSRT